MADNRIIHELLQEVREDQKEAHRKAQEHREDTIEWRNEANNRLDRYNNQLEIHIEGVNTLKGLHKDNVERIEALEKPGNFLNTLKDYVFWCSGIAGAIITLIKLFGKSQG